MSELALLLEDEETTGVCAERGGPVVGDLVEVTPATVGPLWKDAEGWCYEAAWLLFFPRLPGG